MTKQLYHVTGRICPCTLTVSFNLHNNPLRQGLSLQMPTLSSERLESTAQFGANDLNLVPFPPSQGSMSEAQIIAPLNYMQDSVCPRTCAFFM